MYRIIFLPKCFDAIEKELEKPGVGVNCLLWRSNEDYFVFTLGSVVEGFLECSLGL